MGVYGSKETAFDALSRLACIGITDRSWQKDRLSRLEYYKKRYFRNWEDCEGVYLKPDQDEYRMELSELETRLIKHFGDRRAVNTAMSVATYGLNQLACAHYALASRTLRSKLHLSRSSVSKYMILLRTEFPIMKVTEEYSPPWEKGRRGKKGQARRYALNQSYLEELKTQQLTGVNHEPDHQFGPKKYEIQFVATSEYPACCHI